MDDFYKSIDSIKLFFYLIGFGTILWFGKLIGKVFNWIGGKLGEGAVKSFEGWVDQRIVAQIKPLKDNMEKIQGDVHEIKGIIATLYQYLNSGKNDR